MSSLFLKSAIAALAYASIAKALSSKAGSTVDVDGIFYYVPSTPVSNLGVSLHQLKAAVDPGNDLIPATVITGDFSTFDASVLNSTIADFAAKDDVFSTGFLHGGFSKVPSSGSGITC